MFKIFVYGTLKPGGRYYPFYCQGKTTEEVEAYTWGQLFHLPGRGYPAMTLGERKVKGILLTFEDDSALRQIDQLEDYSPTRPLNANEYIREERKIYSPRDEALGEAWCYLMDIKKVMELSGIFVPSGWWQGADFGC